MKALAALKAFISPADTAIAPRAGLIGGLIAMVAAAMAFLAVMATEAGVAADRIAGRWSGELSASATVLITADSGDVDALAQAAVDVLVITPGIADAKVISTEENRALLAPWLGQDADIEALPLPTLIDVTIEGTGPDLDDMNRKLQLAAPGAVYDNHGEWRAPLIETAKGLRFAAAFGVALTVAALAAMVAVAAAATLWSGAGVVRTLRLIGAEDQFIARAFERPFAIRAALGALIGALAALIVASRLPRIEGISAVTGGAPWSSSPTWWLLPLAAIVAGATALIATRLTAIFVLRRSE